MCLGYMNVILCRTAIAYRLYGRLTKDGWKITMNQTATNYKTYGKWLWNIRQMTMKHTAN